MPFSTLVSGAIETTVNQLLSLSSNSEVALDALSAQVVRIKLNEYGRPLYFFIAERKIAVLNEFEGEVSVALALGIDTLIAIKNKHSISDLIKTDKLIIDGDIKVLQQFADLLTGLDIDWAEHLSSVTGDVLAHRLTTQTNNITNKLSNKSTEAKQHLGDYLKHEAKVTISPLEFIHFSDQVAELSAQVTLLVDTVNRLEKP